MPADRLLVALSAASHTALRSSAELRRDTLLLHVQSTPLAEVMRSLAEASNARWRRSGTTWLLERPVEMERAQRDREIAERAARIRQALAPLFAELHGPWNEDTLRTAIPKIQDAQRTGHLYEDVNRMDPVWRALLRCLSDVSPAQLASIPLGGRAVFTTPPRGKIGAGAWVALSELREEQAIFGRTARAAGLPEPFEDQAGPSFSAFNHSAWGRFKPYDAMPDMAQLTVQRKWGTGIDVELSLFDGQHKKLVVLRPTESLIALDEPLRMAPDRGCPVPLALSTASRALMAARNIPSRTSPLSKAARDLLVHPEEHEPLGLLVSDAYLQYARLKHRNLIADLPDSLVAALFEGPDPTQMTVDGLLGWPPYGTPLRMQERGDWTIVSSSHPYEARQAHIDRAVLGRVMRRIAQRGYAAVEDWADFDANAGSNPAVSFGAAYIRLLTRRDPTPASIPNDAILAVYGGLTEQQKAACFSGQRLSYGAFNSQQRVLLEKVIYGARYNYRGSGNGKQIPPAQGDLYDEPAVAFPAGLPADLGMSASESQDRLVYFLAPDAANGDSPFWTINIDHPRETYMGQAPLLPASGFASVKYQVLTQRTVEAQIDVTPWYRLSERFTDGVVRPTGPPVPLDGLPEELRKKVADEIRSLLHQSPSDSDEPLPSGALRSRKIE